jgi:DNA-binding response OmpR family regulator
MLCVKDASTPYIGCQRDSRSSCAEDYLLLWGSNPYAQSDQNWTCCRNRPGVDSGAEQGDNGQVEELLLIVEDDPSLREVIRLGLEDEKFRVVDAEDGPSALIAFASHRPDLVLLDVMLPGLDGFAVCRELRKVSLAPIVMLTARASTGDVVQGLEAGADDYVTKPFEFPELVARVRSVLRRASITAAAADGGLRSGSDPARATGGPGGAAAPPALSLGSLTIDPGSYLVRRGSAEVPLTVTEFRLLYELARHAGQVLSRDQLLELVWGYSYLGDSRLVDVHVQRLRAKIEDDPTHPALILTVRGVGYRATRGEVA